MKHAFLSLFTLYAGALGILSGQAQANDFATAATRVPACAGCHGTAGRSRGTIPPLAGLDKARFIAAMRAFQTGSRPGTVMPRIARGYDEAELAAMAAYFQAQQP